MASMSSSGVRYHKPAEFVVLLYGRYFVSAYLSTAALHIDLSFLLRPAKVSPNQPVIVEAATASMRRHLSYLTPELVVLALVDKDTSEWEKEKMAAQLLEFLRPNQLHGGKPGQSHSKQQAAHLAANQPTLLMIMWARSWVIFKLFWVEERYFAWLHESPSLWLNNVAYCIHMYETTCVWHASG